MSVSQCALHTYYQFVLLGFNPVLCKSTFLRPKRITCGEIKMTVVCASIFPTLFRIKHTVRCQKGTHLNTSKPLEEIHYKLFLSRSQIWEISSCKLYLCWDENYIKVKGGDLGFGIIFLFANNNYIKKNQFSSY